MNPIPALPEHPNCGGYSGRIGPQLYWRLVFSGLERWREALRLAQWRN